MTSNSLSHRRRNARRPPICKKGPTPRPPPPIQGWPGYTGTLTWKYPLDKMPSVDTIAVAMSNVDPLDSNHYWEVIFVSATWTRADCWLDPIADTLTLRIHDWDNTRDHGTADFAPVPRPPLGTDVPVTATTLTPPALDCTGVLYWLH
jgi:hypothetical protein